MSQPDLNLPIEDILPDLNRILAEQTTCVVHAPPGSGKTTCVPLALLDAPWLAGRKIIMLEPRRLAARAAARRMAFLLDEKIGERVGYRTRLDIRISTSTRIEVVTEGILTRMLQADPELSGYACVIFDEFHERSLHADLALALCLETRAALREDLRLVVMSATLDVEAVASLLNGCPVLGCPGLSHEVAIRYAPLHRAPFKGLEEHAALVIRHVLTTEQGSVLVFLPGYREITRTAELLNDLRPDIQVHPLLGALPASAQDAAIAPPESGKRKIVLATSIAETSLTIEGIRVVIDSGLARVPRFDPRSGMTRLLTEPASLATIRQRTGRAGRITTGSCVRLWNEADNVSRKEFPTPEIIDADLAPLRLELALWGVQDCTSLSWLTTPPGGHIRTAEALLQDLGALNNHGRITPHGRDMAALPLHPRLAHMVLRGKTLGRGHTASCLATLLSEQSHALRSFTDLSQAVSSFKSKRGPKPEERVQATVAQIMRLASIPTTESIHPDATGLLTALAYPDRIARRQSDTTYRLTSGRKAIWVQPDPLQTHEFLAIAELDGDTSGARIWRAAALDRASLEEEFASSITTHTRTFFDARLDRVTSVSQHLLGLLIMEEKPLRASSEEITDALLEAMDSLEWLHWSREAIRLRERLNFLHRMWPDSWPDVSDFALLASKSKWLAPFVQNVSKKADLAKLDTEMLLKNLVGWTRLAELGRLAPEAIEVPSGERRRIDYSAESGPVLPVKLQEMFGCAQTPTVADGTCMLTLHLLSPAGRPLQVTQDLASFWKNGYPLVRAEMRGRYPKHPWPEDPTTALATARTKKAMTNK